MQDIDHEQGSARDDSRTTGDVPGAGRRNDSTPGDGSARIGDGGRADGSASVATAGNREAAVDSGAKVVPAGERPAPPTPVTAPIGRLVIAGPDKPRKYVDADLKVDWFGKGGPGEKAGEPGEGAGEPGEKAGGPAESTGEPGRSTGEPADKAAEVTVEEPAAEPAEPAAKEPPAGADGVVIDLDISGLFDGRGVTAEQAMIVARELREQNEKSAPEKPTQGVPTAAELDSIRWRLDGGTLREVVDNREALQQLGEQLDGPLAAEQDDGTKAGLLSVRAEVYRLLGELGMAAAASRLALAHAERASDARAMVIAQAELAHTLRLRGDFDEADRLFEQAASSETPETLRSVVHENAGRSAFDQGRHMEALDHFARAVRLGDETDMDLVERVGVSLEAVYIHVLRDGWGPYPRMRREIIDPEQLALELAREQQAEQG